MAYQPDCQICKHETKEACIIHSDIHNGYQPKCNKCNHQDKQPCIFHSRDTKVNNVKFITEFQNYINENTDFLDCTNFIFPSFSSYDGGDDFKKDILCFRLNSKKVDFTNAIFLDDYHITSNQKIKIDATFKNCNFRNIEFDGIKFGSFDFRDCKANKINFSGCVFPAHASFVKVVAIESLGFNDCYVDIETKTNKDKMLDDFFKSNILFSLTKTDYLYVFDRQADIQNKNANLSPIAESISILDNDEINKIAIGTDGSSKIFRSLGVSEKAKTSLHIDCKQNLELTLEYAGYITLTAKSNTAQIKISRTSIEGSVNANHINGFVAENTTIKKIFEIKDEASLETKNIEIKNSTIEKDGVLKIGDENRKNYESIRFKNLYNFGLISMSNISVNKNFDIIGSTFGRTELNNIDLGKCNTSISNSSADEAKIYGVIWGKVNTNQDGYRQLKHISEKAGNNIGAVKFYAEELEEYKIDKNISYQDKFLLMLSQALSSHGQSYFMPIMWMLLLWIITVSQLAAFLKAKSLIIRFLY